MPASGRQGQIENYAVGAASRASAAEPWASPWDEGASARAREGRSLGSWAQNVRPAPERLSRDGRAARAREFADVYAQNVRRIYGFFGYRVRSREEAEDLTQQTFERALRAWARFDPGRASPPTWLLTIARNLLIDHYRAAPPAQTTVEGHERPYEEPALERGLGVSAELERALAALSDRDRELIALRYGGDLSGPEIAALTGLSLANVQQILSRALRRLRSLLEPAAGVAT